MYLLEKNADPSTRNSDHDAPLHAIIKRVGSIDASTQKASAGVEDKLKKASKEKLGCVVALLTHKKCSPNCKTKGGMTPLHLAVEVTIIYIHSYLYNYMYMCFNINKCSLENHLILYIVFTRDKRFRSKLICMVSTTRRIMQ